MKLAGAGLGVVLFLMLAAWAVRPNISVESKTYTGEGIYLYRRFARGQTPEEMRLVS